ncbi:MAG: hypothetical protein ISR69_00105 [Gammaproteobacteria bacterium]|nr:hypothetical protein [Gammaproteobacteria bacterium]
MHFEIYNAASALEVQKLFSNVFANSEGTSEGELIGNLEFELQETTDKNDFFGFVAKNEQEIVGCTLFLV